MHKDIKHYPLPTNADIQRQYKKIFKTGGFNWKKGHICGEHWSSGERKSEYDIPDVPLPDSQLELIKEKYKRAKNTYDKAANPTPK